MRGFVRALVAAVLVAAPALLLAHVVQRPIDTSAVMPARAGVGAADGTAEIQRRAGEGRSAADYPETARRPLFWPARRPPAPEPEAIPAPAAAAPAPPAAAPPEPPKAELRLAGVMRTRGRPRALIVSPQDPAGRWVEEGGTIEGWRLTRIDGAAVDIEAGGRRQQLRMN